MADLHPTEPAFWCEGCGQRFPARALYSRQAKLDLAKGQAVRRNQRNELVYYTMTCSKRCAHAVTPRRYEETAEYA